MEGDVRGYILKQECDWMNMMEICLGGNWVCVRNGPWRFPRKFLSWILGEQCSGISGWKFPCGPLLGYLYRTVVVKCNGKELGA